MTDVIPASLADNPAAGLIPRELPTETLIAELARRGVTVPWIVHRGRDGAVPHNKHLSDCGHEP